HDRAVDGRSRSTIPDDGRLALVGDPDRRHLGSEDARLGERVTCRAFDGRPDLLGVVLDPPGPRKVLRQLGVPARADAPVGIDDQRGRARRALVESENVAPRGHLSAAARAAVTTASLTSVYWRPASVAPAANAQSRASVGRASACPMWWAETRSVVR